MTLPNNPSDPVQQLIEDFWQVFYGDLSREEHFSGQKCSEISQEINGVISTSSLENFFRGKATPGDAIKGRMSFIVLEKWQEEHAALFAEKGLTFNEKELSKTKMLGKYFMTYCQLLSQAREIVLPPNTVTNSGEPTKNKTGLISILNEEIPRYSFQITPKIKKTVSICGMIILGLMGGLYFMNLLDLTQAGTAASSKEHLFFLLGGSVAQFLLIAIMIPIYFLNQPKRKIIIEAATQHTTLNALRQFNTGWLLLWLSWLVLYGWLSFKWWYEMQLLNDLNSYFAFSAYSWALADILNVLSAIFFFYLFFVLDMKSVRGVNQQEGRNRRFQYFLSNIIFLSTLVLCFSILDRFLDLSPFEDAGTILYAYLTGIAMLFFFGRLDSHLFDLKRWELGLFYLYGVIQASWSSLESTDNVILSAAIFLMAFAFKFYLFFKINNWLQRGDFDEYFQRIEQMHETKVSKQ